MTRGQAAGNAPPRRSSDIWVIISAYRTKKISDDHPHPALYGPEGLVIFDHPPCRLGAADACAGRIGRHGRVSGSACLALPVVASLFRRWRRGLAGQCSACAYWTARWLPRHVRLGRRSMEGSVSGGSWQECISGVMQCSGLVSGALPLPPGRRKARPPSGATPRPSPSAIGMSPLPIGSPGNGTASQAHSVRKDLSDG